MQMFLSSSTTPPPLKNSYPVAVATDFWFLSLFTAEMASYIVAITVQFSYCILFGFTCTIQEFYYNSDRLLK